MQALIIKKPYIYHNLLFITVIANYPAKPLPRIINNMRITAYHLKILIPKCLFYIIEVFRCRIQKSTCSMTKLMTAMSFLIHIKLQKKIINDFTDAMSGKPKSFSTTKTITTPLTSSYSHFESSFCFHDKSYI